MLNLTLAVVEVLLPELIPIVVVVVNGGNVNWIINLNIAVVITKLKLTVESLYSFKLKATILVLVIRSPP